MAYTTIKKPSDYFQTELWSSVDTSIDTLNFQPDFAWIKSRTNADSHVLFDAVRGANKRLTGASTSAESTTSDELTAFNSNGYTLGTGSNVNRSGHNYVSWNWLANGAGSANTDGTINSTVSANTTSGFSVVSYTGTGANATVGHGLSSAPSMIIVKNRSAVKDWVIYHKSLGNTKFLEFTTSGEQTASNRWNNTTPTNSVFSLGSDNGANGSGNSHIAYCFAEKQGYSKFGSYTGNGNADGTFVYTGFKPAFVMIKLSTAADDWQIFDNKRNTFNIMDKYLRPNSSLGTVTNAVIDFTSNGFKLRSSAGSFNPSGGTAIYMAFAEEPLVGDNPCTAR